MSIVKIVTPVKMIEILNTQVTSIAVMMMMASLTPTMGINTKAHTTIDITPWDILLEGVTRTVPQAMDQHISWDLAAASVEL